MLQVATQFAGVAAAMLLPRRDGDKFRTRCQHAPNDGINLEVTASQKALHAVRKQLLISSLCLCPALLSPPHPISTEKRKKEKELKMQTAKFE